MGRLRHAEVRDLWDTMCEDGAQYHVLAHLCWEVN